MGLSFLQMACQKFQYGRNASIMQVRDLWLLVLFVILSQYVIGLMQNKAWCPRGMLVLVVIARENFDSGHFELFNFFPGRWLLRPAFLVGIKHCDVIMHKVYSFRRFCIIVMV
jgi:hypothetical protein